MGILLLVLLIPTACITNYLERNTADEVAAESALKGGPQRKWSFPDGPYTEEVKCEGNLYWFDIRLLPARATKYQGTILLKSKRSIYKLCCINHTEVQVIFQRKSCDLGIIPSLYAE